VSIDNTKSIQFQTIWVLLQHSTFASPRNIRTEGANVGRDRWTKSKKTKWKRDGIDGQKVRKQNGKDTLDGWKNKKTRKQEKKRWGNSG
jgi:hypothetical protein